MNSLRGAYTAPAQQPRVIGKTLKYKSDQEHLLRRLASALVLQWDNLPDALQDIIIDQAALVEDREGRAGDARNIETFIRRAKVCALTKIPADQQAITDATKPADLGSVGQTKDKTACERGFPASKASR